MQNCLACAQAGESPHAQGDEMLSLKGGAEPQGVWCRKETMIRVLVLVEMFARSSFLNFQKKIFFNCFF